MVALLPLISLSRLVSDNVTSLFPLLMASTTRGFEFAIALISAKKASSDSLSKLLLCLQNWWKYSTSRQYLSPSYIAHMTCERRVHLPLYPISNLCQQEFSNFVVIHFSDALFKFVFDPNAIFSIFTPNRSYNSSPSNKSSQGHNEWICLESLCHFNMDCSTSQTCKKCTIWVQSCSPLFDFKRTKHVVTTVSEWRLFLCSFWL